MNSGNWTTLLYFPDRVLLFRANFTVKYQFGTEHNKIVLDCVTLLFTLFVFGPLRKLSIFLNVPFISFPSLVIYMHYCEIWRYFIDRPQTDFFPPKPILYYQEVALWVFFLLSLLHQANEFNFLNSPRIMLRILIWLGSQFSHHTADIAAILSRVIEGSM